MSWLRTTAARRDHSTRGGCFKYDGGFYEEAIRAGRFKHLHEAQRRTGRRTDEGEGKGGGPSERRPLVVTGQRFHVGALRATYMQILTYSRAQIRERPLYTLYTADITELHSDSCWSQKFRSPAAITRIREHTQTKISLQYAVKILMPIRKLIQNICSHKREEFHDCIFL